MSKTIERRNMTQTDSKGRVTREPKNLAETNVNFRWWVLDEDEMAPAIAATILFIKQHQGSRIEQLTISTRLYGHTSMYNLIGTAFTRASAVNSTPMTQRISYNLCASVVETLEAKMAKNKIVPTFITNGADWKVQKKAEQLTKFSGGLFYQAKVHEKSIIAFNDAGVWGDGFVQIYEDNDQVCIDRVLPHELFVDTVESLTSEPHQLHRVRLMDRDIALQLLPELEEQIKTVSPANYQEIGGQGTAVDIIQVTESWHLKSGPDANDGLHVFCVGDGAIAEDYDKDYFPFAHLRYVRRKLGWYGQGACERLMTIQGEINRCMMLKQRALWMQSAFKVLVENGSKVVSQHLDNEVGAVIHYSGTPPQYVTPPATNPELQDWINSLIERGYQQEGASQLSSSGEVPMGVKSGKAMRTLNQITDDRFIFMQQNMEDFCLEIAKQSINVVKDIFARTKKYEVVFPDTSFIETIDWADVQLDEEQYVLKAYPTSSLSDDLTGRLAEVQELTQAGMITPRSSRRLMDMPDVEMADSLANAAEDRLTQIFENMLEKGEVTRFEPGFHDAQLAVQLGIKYVNYAQFYNCPDDKVQLVRDYIAQVNAEALSQIPGVIAPEMSAGTGVSEQGVPQAEPQAPPVNNLIQNVPGVV
jgi:hypothetical protein